MLASDMSTPDVTLSDLGSFVTTPSYHPFHPLNHTYHNVTEAHPYDHTWLDLLALILKGLIFGTIIVSAVLGNALVIISVQRNRKLRVITNYYVVSLAMADMLVALCAMTFNASVELSGKWLFGYFMCDVWNSLDVYFSTASILHLCCISVDRYYAIVRPLEYPITMTHNTVLFMLANVWFLPALISFTPIFLGWYTTAEHQMYRQENPNSCVFVVNQYYAIISSCVSFWIPGVVMVTMYARIYKEAVRQRKALSRTSSNILLNSVHMHHTNHAMHHSHHMHYLHPSDCDIGLTIRQLGRNDSHSSVSELDAPINRTDEDAGSNITEVKMSDHRDSAGSAATAEVGEALVTDNPECGPAELIKLATDEPCDARWDLADKPIANIGSLNEVSNSGKPLDKVAISYGSVGDIVLTIRKIGSDHHIGKYVNLNKLMSRSTDNIGKLRENERLICSISEPFGNMNESFGTFKKDKSNRNISDSLNILYEKKHDDERLIKTCDFENGNETLVKPIAVQKPDILINSHGTLSQYYGSKNFIDEISDVTNGNVSGTSPSENKMDDKNGNLDIAPRVSGKRNNSVTYNINVINYYSEPYNGAIADGSVDGSPGHLVTASSRHSTSSTSTYYAVPTHSQRASELNSNGGSTMRQSQKSWKAEHKAARTLGIIMGVFLICWLPFFLWYVITTICGDSCPCPDVIIATLFWIGYFNSALNPLIYAYFNRDFREAFKNTLECVFPACYRREKVAHAHYV